MLALPLAKLWPIVGDDLLEPYPILALQHIDATSPDFSIFTGLFSLLIIAGFGLLARTGTTWLKYVLLAFLFIGLIGFTLMITFYLANPIIGMANLIQTILQGTSIFFLFRAATKDSKLPITFPPTTQS